MSGPVDYSPQGSGPHPTLAGNVLDPNVKADGQMSQGQGVGGTSEQHVREEGLEHIKRNTDLGSGSTSGEGQSSNTGTSSTFGSPPPASNPGSDDPSGGISGGGVSGSAYKEAPIGDEATLGSEPERTTSGGSGIIASTLSYLGMGGKSEEQQGVAGEAKNAAGYETQTTAPTSYESTSTSGSGLGGESTSTTEIPDRSYGEGGAAAFGAGTVPSDSTYSTTDLPDRSTGEGRAAASGGPSDRSYGEGEGAAAAGAGALGADTIGGSSSLGATNAADSNDPQVDTSAASSKPMDSDVTTGGDPTDSADPTTEKTATSSGGSEETGDASEQAKKEDNKVAAKRENPDAIPTAGGEKLGSKHWGESKIVPDNPKPEESSKVSSSDGQPTDQVRDNTNKNAGAAPQGGHSDTAEKGTLVDKMKANLHMGHK
ncbi:hypothetical protein LTR85_001952 [Meristemomyces frigidus]|nr:hypothetical protein LTR85_001952 [Meristemomyces frigidus]